MHARLETKEGEKELYRLDKQRDRAEKDIQHVRVIKDENTEPRTEEAEVINEEVNWVSREEVKNAQRRMKKSTAVGSDELPVEV